MDLRLIPCSGGIYFIKNTVTNKMYIGESNNLNIRLHDHQKDLCNLTHDKAAMNEDCKKFGIFSFDIGVLEYFDPLIWTRQKWRAEVEREWFCKLEPAYNSSRHIKEHHKIAKNYIWRNFDPKNPDKNRNNPKFEAAYKWTNVATVPRYMPEGEFDTPASAVF